MIKYCRLLLQNFPHLHREGYFVFLVMLFLSFIIFSLSNSLGVCLLVTGLFVASLYRDPERIISLNEKKIISPIDGKVIAIIESEQPNELELPDGKYHKIIILSSLFANRTQRFPLSGEINELSEGSALSSEPQFINSIKKSRAFVISASKTLKIGLKQEFAGITRLIGEELKNGQTITQGDKMDIISLGQILELYIPKDKTELQVVAGQSVIAGETMLGNIK